MKDSALPDDPYEKEVWKDPVQGGRRNVKTLREFNVSVPVTHVPIVSHRREISFYMVSWKP